MASRYFRRHVQAVDPGVPEPNFSADNSLELFGLEKTRCFEGIPEELYYISWSSDGKTLAAGGANGYVGIWTLETGQERRLTGHSHNVLGISWHPSRPILATAATDGTLRLWDIDTGRSEVIEVIIRDEPHATGLAWFPDGRRLAVTDYRGVIAIWDVTARAVLHQTDSYGTIMYHPQWSSSGLLFTFDHSGTARGHTAENLELIYTIPKVTHSIAPSPGGTSIALGLADGAISIWDLAKKQEIATLEGHTAGINSLSFSSDGKFLASFGDNIRLWRCRDWACVATVSRDRSTVVGGLEFHPSLPLLAAKNQYAGMDEGSLGARIDLFALDCDRLDGVTQSVDSRHYVNAKVVLLGNTGVGKSGLGLVLSGQPYRTTESTHGRHVWMLESQEVETPGGGLQTREILLWDLAGQPGYRVVHQLHLGEIAIALVVFDARSETDPFTGVKHWVRALGQARRLEGSSAVPLRMYLVAARADRGGVAVTRERVQAMLDDLGLDGFFETSAKEGWQVADLAHAIRDGIAWDALPMVSSSALFGSIKEFLVEEKERGRLLSTAEDLFRGFQRARPELASDDGLRASFETCVGRVESRGLIRRVHFGGLVLLQPELLDAYASAMVQAAKEEPDGLGFIAEDDALAGSFRLSGDERVRDRAQEKLLLIATVEELLRHEIALKAATERGVHLVFPSQFTRERPDAPDIPGKQVVFTFDGPLYSIYATLAVRLSHSALFRRQAMWQNAASYASVAGGICGMHLRELEEGRGELALSYDDQTDAATRAQFETYVAEHLQLRSLPGTLTRRQIRTCPACGYVLPDDLVRLRVERGSFTIGCPVCDGSVIALRDETPVRPEAAVAQMNRSADDRRDQNVAAARLRGKVEMGDYDVFLCYSSADRDSVKAIGERLKEAGLLPWLDVWDIKPGTRWQQELQRQIKSVKSAAVFIGRRGRGPWQDVEVEALLSQLVKRKCPVIPVILEGRVGQPQLPPFLGTVQVVDMRQSDPDPFRQLVWGITGERSPLPGL